MNYPISNCTMQLNEITISFEAFFMQKMNQCYSGPANTAHRPTHTHNGKSVQSIGFKCKNQYLTNSINYVHIFDSPSAIPSIIWLTDIHAFRPYSDTAVMRLWNNIIFSNMFVDQIELFSLCVAMNIQFYIRNSCYLHFSAPFDVDIDGISTLWTKRKNVASEQWRSA